MERLFAIVEVPAPVINNLPAESNVEVALENCCNAVQVFALPRLRSAVIVPEVVTGVLPIVSVPELESPTDVTEAAEVLQVPEPVIAPVPLPVKHPVRVETPVPPSKTSSNTNHSLLET